MLNMEVDIVGVNDKGIEIIELGRSMEDLNKELNKMT